MLDVAKEEKTHTGEFQALLKQLDKEYAREVETGAKEALDKISGKINEIETDFDDMQDKRIAKLYSQMKSSKKSKNL